MIDRGVVRRDRNGWTRDDLSDLAIPQSVKAAIGHRLDKRSLQSVSSRGQAESRLRF
jgi:hypothetical protein